MTVTISKAVLRRAVQALRDVAANQAGLSQQPYLFSREETEQWADARELEFWIKSLPKGPVQTDTVTE